jgi:hypothetical protein
MASWRAMHRYFGTLCFALTAASPSFSQSGSAVAQSSVAIFWDAAKCLGGYQPDNYSVHCEPGPSATILDFKTKMQFFCVNNEAVDIRWEISTDPNRGSPIRPSQINWRPECWKMPLGFDVDPNTTILRPQYSQTPPPNYYMTMNVVVVYDPAKPTIKACLVPLFPRFPVQPACADAEIRS